MSREITLCQLEELLLERFTSIMLTGVAKERFIISARSVQSPDSCIVLERTSIEQCLRDANDLVQREGR